MLKLLGVCETIERTMAQIYRLLAKNETADPRLRTIWLEMAKDEDDHAAQLQLAQRLASERVFQEKSGMLLDDVTRLQHRAQRFLELLKARSLSETDALRMAIALEAEFKDAHVNTALRFEDKGLEQMFQALCRADEQHVQGLKNYVAARPDYRNFLKAACFEND